MEDFCRDFVACPSPAQQHGGARYYAEHVLYSRYGLGRRQHGPSEFMAFPDRDVPFGLGFIPTEADYRYMAHCAGRGHMHHLMGSSEDSAPPGGRASAPRPAVTIDDHGTFAEIGDIVEGAVPRDEYVDEMLAMSLSQTEEIAPSSLHHLISSGCPSSRSPRRSRERPTLWTHLSFDVLSGFVSRHDYVSDFSSMDLSTFEYLPVSHVIDLSAPSSPTSQIFDIDDEIAQHDSDDDSSSVPIQTHQPRELRIGSICLQMREIASSSLLRSYLDVFAWSYEDMPGLDPSIVQHRLPLLPHARPVKQKLRRLHPLELAGERGDQKQLSVGFLSVVEYPEWLANVVPVPKRTARSFDVVLYGRIFRVQSDLDGSRGHGEDVLHYRVGERGIEVDPDKIRAILDMPAPRTERESQPTVWDDQCSAFERIREYLLSPPVWRLLHQVVLYSILVRIRRGLGLHARLVGRLMRWLVLLTEFDIHYVTQKSIRGSIVRSLAHYQFLMPELLMMIPDEDVAAVTSLSGWRISVRLAFSDRHPATNNIVEYEACILGLETVELGIRQMEVFGDSNLLLVGRFDDLRYTHLPRAQNQFADALATLASMIDIPVDATVRPLLIESRSAPATVVDR
ncbi:hypothetical protein CK203_050770 [Vitis vinifera]|uniref:RNase H type-1 domain-containing protein n=1 Tax=Vitis vinifera TaxID=29760 RepID=A0A438HCM5_VITVI|nr:hypothetical protein CK203_050770 [Vitis vinifera]